MVIWYHHTVKAILSCQKSEQCLSFLREKKNYMGPARGLLTFCSFSVVVVVAQIYSTMHIYIHERCTSLNVQSISMRGLRNLLWG